MIYCDNCPYKQYCIARLNDRTITGCNLPLYWSGLISKGDVVIEHTVKGGDGMSRLDDAISDVACILDTLMAYRRIVETGDCNSCGNKTCKYRPKLGELVRYNCPYFTHTVTVRIDDEVTE